MPIKGKKKFGDLYVKLIVNLPKKLDDSSKTLFGKLFENMDWTKLLIFLCNMHVFIN